MAVYLLDPGQGRFTVQAFAEGFLSAMGHSPTLAVRRFFGEVGFDPTQPNAMSAHVTVRADSLEVLDDVSKKDRAEIESRMGGEVLEVARFPDISFRSETVTSEQIGDNQFRFQITGILSLHGRVRNQSIGARLRLDSDELSLRGDFRLKQSDFQIQRVSALAGAIRVKDELTLAFDLVAVREKT